MIPEPAVPPRSTKLLQWVCPGIGLILVGMWCQSVAGSPALAWDFPLFYAAGKIEASELYRLSRQEQEQQTVWAVERRGQQEFHFSPFLRPPHYRVLLEPLARLGFWPAFGLWTAAQVASLVAALWLLSRRYGFNPVWFVLLPLCPYLTTAVNWGQDTPLVLLVLVLTLELLVTGRDLAAGGVLALALVKWNLVALVPVLLLAHRRWRFLAGFLAVAGLEAAFGVSLIGWAGLQDYMAALRGDYADYLSPGMPSARGLLLLAGAPSSAAVVTAAAGIVMTAWALRRLKFPLAFSAAVSASVILTYHTMVYDLLFLILPLFTFRHVLDTGWRAAVTVFWLSPIPVLAGGFLPGAAAILFVATAVEAGLRYPTE